MTPSPPPTEPDPGDHPAGAARGAARGPRRNRWRLAALVGLLSYAVAEAALSLAALGDPPDTFFVIEQQPDGPPVIAFDAASGFRYGPHEFRMARVNRGRAEFVCRVRANRDGFPDDAPLGAPRADPRQVRIAVLGDSFTAGTGLDANWPRVLERRQRDAGWSVELVNLSLSGIGLANWWRMLDAFVRHGPVEVDGIVLAVWGDDLGRGFYFAHAEPAGAVGSARPAAAPPSPPLGWDMLHGRVDSWQPRDFPTSLADARPHLLGVPRTHLVPPERFDAAVEGRWWPRREPELVLAAGAWRRLSVWWRRGETSVPDAPEPGSPRGQLILDIATFTRSRRLPALVVAVPALQHLPPGPEPSAPARAARQLAELLGADFLDGAEAFAGVERHQLPRYWHTTDYHWNQRGSDRFADWLAPRLRAWIEQ